MTGERQTDWESTRLLPVGTGRTRFLLAAFLALFVPPRNHRTYPTSAGWMIILISVSIGGAAYNTNSNILFLSLSCLLSSLLLSGLLSVVNFRGLRWRLVFPERLEVGRVSDLAVEVENLKRLMPTYAVWFRLGVGDGRRERLILDGRLGAGTRRRLVRRVRPEHRGELGIELSGVESTFPFGFLRKRLGLRTEASVLVWPRQVTVERMLPRGPTRRQAGQRVQAQGRGTDLRLIREYRAGDPFQDIDWKATARTGDLMTRETQEEGTTAYTLILDASAILWKDGEMFEIFCSVAASVGRYLHERGDLLGYWTDSDGYVPVRSRADMHRLLDTLACMDMGETLARRDVEVPGRAIYFAKGGEHGVVPDFQHAQLLPA